MSYNQNINPYASCIPGQPTAMQPIQSSVMQQPQQLQQQVTNTYVPQNRGMMDYVTDENAARNYPIGPNNKILLMDQFNNVFYIKTTDTFGNTNSFRIFSYMEGSGMPMYSAPAQQGTLSGASTSSAPQIVPSDPAPITQDNNSAFITKEEFNSRMDELMSFFDEKTKPKKEVTKK